MITRITFSTAKPRKHYPVGSTRLRGGKTYIKQFRMTFDSMSRKWCYLGGRGGTKTEWVVKDGPNDRESPNWEKPKNW